MKDTSPLFDSAIPPLCVERFSSRKREEKKAPSFIHSLLSIQSTGSEVAVAMYLEYTERRSSSLFFFF